MHRITQCRGVVVKSKYLLSIGPQLSTENWGNNPATLNGFEVKRAGSGSREHPFSSRGVSFIRSLRSEKAAVNLLQKTYENCNSPLYI